MKKKIQPRLLKTLVAFAVSVVGGHGFAETQPCDDQLVWYSNYSCLLKVLREVDERLNEAYRRQLQDGSENDRGALRDAQRRWIAGRNSTCQIDERRNVTREAWINALVGDPIRANCVLQHTTARTAELESQKSAPSRESPLFFSEIKPTTPESAYATRSQSAHRSGKFYFEVVVDHGKITRSIEADIQLRVSEGTQYVAATYSIRPQDLVIRLGDTDSVTIVGGNLGTIRLPRAVIGVAVDLDANKFFHHRDGDWKGKTPSSGNGLILPSGDYFVAEVSSSISMSPLIKEKVLSVNFGDHPFVYPLPGYVAFDGGSQKPKEAVPLTSVPAVAPGAPIAGQPLSTWIQRYWQWIWSFPTGKTPTDDSQGASCDSEQSQTVFFLTGSPKSTPVSRVCTIPRGKYVLVPLINILAQVNAGTQVSCDALMRPVGQVNETVTDLSLTINGQTLLSPERYRAESGCFELRDLSSGVSRTAAGAGYWVVLKPLAVGNYDLRFTGKYRANGFAQDIAYQIRVE